MSSKLLTSTVIFAICTALSACSSVSDTLPVVKIERKKPKTIKVQDADYTSASSKNFNASAQNEQAAIACQNEKMRVRAADDNADNDTARMLILDDNDDNSSNVIGEVLVNCREYFARNATSLVPASFGTPEPTPTYERPAQRQPQFIAPAPAVAPKVKPQAKAAPRASQDTGLFYSVRRGDTLYGIARQHCTSVKAIKRLNNISNPKALDVNDVLRMPVGNCD